MTPQLAVIVPVYNTKEYLSACIESINNQSYEDKIIYIVDDGSTDGSSELCDIIVNKYKNIKVIHQKNKGLSGARNTALKIIYKNPQIKYVTFIDSDDEYGDPETLEKNIKILGNDSRLDLVQFPVIVKEDGKYDHTLAMVNITLKDQEDILNCFYKRILRSSVCNKIFKIESLEGLLFDEGYVYEDEIFLSRLMPNLHKIYLNDKGSYIYNIRFGSITHSKETINKRKSVIFAKFALLDSIRLINKFSPLYITVFNDFFNILSLYLSNQEEFRLNNSKEIIKKLKLVTPPLKSFFLNTKKRKKHILVKILLIKILGVKLSMKLLNIRANKNT